jgi:hypothetical protein
MLLHCSFLRRPKPLAKDSAKAKGLGESVSIIGIYDTAVGDASGHYMIMGRALLHLPNLY